MIDIQNNFSERLFIGQVLQIFKKPNRQSTREWAEENRFLTSDVTADPGKMDCSKTPWMLFVMDCFDDPAITVMIGKKSAQIAWTETINNCIGRTIDLDPRNIMIAFARAASQLKFYKEKLVPFIKHTPVIKDKITGNFTRISHKHIPYEGGFLVLANIGAADDGKSSVIAIVIVEEPDGVKADVNNQGDGMSILKQRMKSFSDPKLIYAGTPTDKDFSQVDLAYEQSNKMVYMVPCPTCCKFHTLDFANLKYDPWQNRKIDEFYGIYNPETAYYTCPHCLSAWNDDIKNEAVKNAVNFNNKGWVATKPEVTDVYGFSFNELLSPFKASSLVNLAKQKLKAEVAYNNGSEGLMKSFTNNSMGEAYVPLNAGLSIEELKARRMNYPEMVVPYEGLLLTAGIDVQHNRFAVIVRAHGRDGNSWLVCWTEIFGDVLDRSDVVWTKLTEFILQNWPHAAGRGKKLRIAAATIDSADGTTTQLVYQWVAEMATKYGHRQIFAGRGIGELKFNTYEIYNEPAAMELSTDPQIRRSLAQTMGATIHLIGAYRAHEEVLRRVNLKGTRDRMYHCETSYPGYEEGLLSCRKTFGTDTVKYGYKLIPGKRKEVVDCEKMALHAFMAIQGHNFTNVQWSKIEEHLHSVAEKFSEFNKVAENI